jgi:hypothetical protein
MAVQELYLWGIEDRHGPSRNHIRLTLLLI